VEKLAMADPRIAVSAEMFDADLWLLNTPGGYVDLRTGQLHPTDPTLLMMKCAAVTPAPAADCPVWFAFLDRALAGDVQMIAFMQRVLGYCLSGDTREEALFFCYGSGGNGKSVMLNTAAGIFGDYSKAAPMETFVDSKNERHPTDLAGLMGARLVTVSETERSQRWAESKIKRLTGRDAISARFMHGDFFEYRPQFKLLFAGNHRPTLSGVDESIRRRFNMLPFTVTVPAAERDPGLPDKLRAEWPGILRWMIEGCLAWQRVGLQPPDAVKAFTAEYLSEQDALAMWVAEKCDTDPLAFHAKPEMYASWAQWCIRNGENAGTQRDFVQRLLNASAGAREHKRDGTRGLMGLRLKPLQQPPIPERDNAQGS
jgi:putative DNA primase/helicase